MVSSMGEDRMNDYECTSSYWNSVALNEPVSKASIPEIYTQKQCLKAFELGLRHTRGGFIQMLKTDLWTEGVVRSREVLNHAIRLAWQKGYYVKAHGIDISPVICAKAISNLTKAEIKQGDIRHLEYPDYFFNLILDVSTIDHVVLSDAITVLGEYNRCLTTGGVLVLMFAHDRGALDRNDYRQDYFPFPVATIRENIQRWANIKGEYAVHFLNFRPMNRPMALSIKLGFAWLLAWLFGWFEFTPFSKLLNKYAPLYVIIGVKK